MEVWEASVVHFLLLQVARKLFKFSTMCVARMLTDKEDSNEPVPHIPVNSGLSCSKCVPRQRLSSILLCSRYEGDLTSDESRTFT